MNFSKQRLTQSEKRMPKNFDNVTCPSHYNQGDVECIDGIKASMSPKAFQGYLKGNIQKYVWRYEIKKEPVEDLRKARWYLDRLIMELVNGTME